MSQVERGVIPTPDTRLKIRRWLGETGSEGNGRPLAERLRAARERRGLTQDAAAREIGVSRLTLSRAENGTATREAANRKLRRWLGAGRAVRADPDCIPPSPLSGSAPTPT